MILITKNSALFRPIFTITTLINQGRAVANANGADHFIHCQNANSCNAMPCNGTMQQFASSMHSMSFTGSQCTLTRPYFNELCEVFLQPKSVVSFIHIGFSQNSKDTGGDSNPENKLENDTENETNATEINTRSDFLDHKWEVLQLDDVIQLLNEENAKDIVVIQVPKEMCYVDYFIIATAMSGRHLASMAEFLNKLYKQKRKGGQPFTIIEGKRVSDEWQCIDIGNMVVHLMLEETREEYQLEKLWVLGPKHDDLLLEKPSEEEIIRRMQMQGLNLMSMDQNTVTELGDISPWDINEEDSFESDDYNMDKNWKSDQKLSNEDKELDDDDAFLV